APSPSHRGHRPSRRVGSRPREHAEVVRPGHAPRSRLPRARRPRERRRSAGRHPRSDAEADHRHRPSRRRHHRGRTARPAGRPPATHTRGRARRLRPGHGLPGRDQAYPGRDRGGRAALHRRAGPEGTRDGAVLRPSAPAAAAPPRPRAGARRAVSPRRRRARRPRPRGAVRRRDRPAGPPGRRRPRARRARAAAHGAPVDGQRRLRDAAAAGRRGRRDHHRPPGARPRGDRHVRARLHCRRAGGRRASGAHGGHFAGV
ncbi:MAG: Glycerophosphoryl diester phosphodiesterase, partial [uncultured Solirubrobacteraceae bacterium]